MEVGGNKRWQESPFRFFSFCYSRPGDRFKNSISQNKSEVQNLPAGQHRQIVTKS